ncbi:MAG TPA: hypothetical protein VH950_10590 [Gaiellaceae bacterium]
MPLLAAVAGPAARVVELVLAAVGRLFGRFAALPPVAGLIGLWERLAGSGRRWLVPALALWVLAVWAVLRELDRLLREMHPPGASSYGAGALANALGAPDPGTAASVLETWNGLGSALRRSPELVHALHAGVDLLLFIPAYTTLLAIALCAIRRELSGLAGGDAIEQSARRRLRRRGEEGDEALAGERARVRGLLDVYDRLAWISLVALPLVAVAAAAAALLSLALVQVDPESAWFDVLWYPLWALATLKAVGLVGVIVPGLAAALSLAVLHPGKARTLLATLVVVRAQVVLVVLFAAGVLYSDQAIDVLRRWREDPVDAVAGILLTVALGCLLVVLARDLMAASAEARRDPPGLPLLILTALALALAAVMCGVLWDLGEGLYVPAAIVLAIGALSWPVRGLQPDRRRPCDAPGGRWLPAFLGSLPPVLLGLALLRATVPALAYEAVGVGNVLAEAALAAVAVVLLAVGLVIGLGASAIEAVWRPRRRLLGGLAAGVVALVALRVWLNPWRTSEVLGAVGVFAAFSIGALLVTTWLCWLAERYRPPPAFVVLRLKRVPVFVLLLVWLALAGTLDGDGAYYDVRRAEATPAAAALQEARLDAGALLADWLELAPRRGEVVPLVVVAAAGGGIRAAFWTDLVLRCVLEGRGSDLSCAGGGEGASSAGSGGALFAASGISGGSLGLAAYAAHLRDPNDGPDWVERRLDDDYIAPTAAWALFVDLPLAFVRRDGGADRAEVLERAFERSWVERPADGGLAGLLVERGARTPPGGLAAGLYDTYATRREDGYVPLLLLSGTKVRDGCRLNTSVLDAAVDPASAPGSPASERLVEDCLALRLFEERLDTGLDIYVPPPLRDAWSLAATDDLGDFLCAGEDVRLSTAVLLSARFPFVLPSGRLPRCGAAADQAVNVVDGGYFDTSGASPLVELLGELSAEIGERNRAGGTCIVPFFLQIDTGYDDPVRSRLARPLEALVPLIAVKSARNAREANARQAAALLFSGPVPGEREAVLGGEEADRYAHIYPRAHPGAKAPLGWTLSKTARADLDYQLTVNTGEIRKVRSWLSGGLSCRDAG